MHLAEYGIVCGNGWGERPDELHEVVHHGYILLICYIHQVVDSADGILIHLQLGSKDRGGNLDSANRNTARPKVRMAKSFHDMLVVLIQHQFILSYHQI